MKTCRADQLHAIYKQKSSSPVRLVILLLLAAVFVLGIGGIFFCCPVFHFPLKGHQTIYVRPYDMAANRRAGV